MDIDAGSSSSPESNKKNQNTTLSIISKNHHVISFCRRPRLLYYSTFCWMSLCGGRFLALFLEHSCHLTSTEIGTALAVQQVVSMVAGTWAGAWADARQRQNPCSGRAEVMAVGVISGTAFFVLNGVGWKVLDDESALWHVLLLAAFAVSSSLVFPVLDGLTIDFLKRNDDNSNIDSGNKAEDDYGKERLYGAISWAITHVATAPLLDLFGFARVLYPLTVLSCVFVLISLYIYVIHADSTDSKKQRYRRLSKRSNNTVLPNDTTEDGLDAYYDDTECTESTGVDMPVLSRPSFTRRLSKRSNDFIEPEDTTDGDMENTGSPVRHRRSLTRRLSKKRSGDIAEPDDTAIGDVKYPVDLPSPHPSSTGVVKRDASEQQQDNQLLESQPMDLQEQQDRLSTRILLQLLVSSTGGDAFLFCLFCLSSGTILVESFVFLFFEILGSSDAIMGWTVVLTVVFEIPLFQIAPYLLKRLGGSHNMLLLACFCYTTRVIGYSLVPNGHILYVFLLEPLHGVTYAFSQMASVDFVVQSNLPVGYEASGQGLVQLFRGFGSTIGLLVGGWAEDAAGPRILYRVAAGVVTVGAAVLGANQLLLAQFRSTMTMEKQSGHVPLQQQLQQENGDAVELTETFELSDSGED